MKKIVSLVVIGFSFTVLQAQEIQDAVQYSQKNLTGTARFRAMSGAFGALGGDLSSINVNPAGSAVFNYNLIGVTASNFNSKNKSDYFGTTTSQKENSFDLNQLGAVFVFDNYDSSSKWRKLSIAINYDNTTDFDNSFFSAGTNPTTSVDQYFLSYANGIPLNRIANTPYTALNYAEQQAFFGYEGYIIDPVNPNDQNNTAYASNVPAGGNYYQENFLVSRGFNGKLSFNTATQYKDNIYMGLNLNAHFVDYRRSTSFYESNSNDTDNGVQQLRFDNDLYTYGNGFSFQLGTIIKLSDALRAGVAYESPTWYRMNDEFSQYLIVENREDGQSFTDVVDPQIINLYPAYKIQTPGSLTGSLAYVFMKRGLISFDYSRKDYSNTKFKPVNDSYFSDLNNQMSNILTQTNEFRLGAEYKIKEWSLRGGYRFEESPYKDSKILGDLTSFSGGFGYNFGDTKLDLAYTYAKQDFNQGFFSQGLTSPANINSVRNNVTLTLLFQL